MNIEETVQWLLDQPLEEFRGCVQTDLMKKGSPELHEGLRHPDVVDRWYMALLWAEMSVKGQLATRDEDLASKRAKLMAKIIGAQQRQDPTLASRFRIEEQDLLAEHAAGRAKTLRFKMGLDQWLVEARHLRALRDPDRLRDRWAARVLMLEEAIARHREEMLAEEIDPSEMDQTLWKVID